MTLKQAIRAAVFWAGFIYILITVTYIVRTNGDVKDRFAGFYAEKDDSIDVLMVGSSPVYPFYAAPKMYGEEGIVAYPMSTNNQRPKAMKYLITEALKTQDPSLIIIEMRMFSMPDEEWGSAKPFTRGVTDNMKYSWNRVKAIHALTSFFDGRYTFYFDIFKYHSNWKTLVMPSQLACWRYEKLHPLKGLELKYGVGPAEYIDRSKITERTEPQDKQVAVLQDLLSYLKGTGKEVLFLISPYVMEEEAKKQFNYLTAAVEEAGYPVLDLNTHIEEMGLDFSTDTYDYGSHVNVLGQAKCTSYLEKYLAEYYDLPDRRKEKGYESWNEAYRLYLEKQAEAEDSCRNDIANENWMPKIVK